MMKKEKKTAPKAAIARGVDHILHEAYARYARDRATRAAVREMLGPVPALAR